MLFLWGVPNAGKSAFQDVLALLLDSYGSPLSDGFLMKNDKRTFELSQLMGKRGVFSGEVPRGAEVDPENETVG
jgi:phage/plasmid-associated DNA primase